MIAMFRFKYRKLGKSDLIGLGRLFRFEQMANEMLADTTIAGQEGVIEYVANSAALQQFEQTSLAYLMLSRLQQPTDAEGICKAVEELLEKEFQVRSKGTLPNNGPSITRTARKCTTCKLPNKAVFQQAMPF